MTYVAGDGPPDVDASHEWAPATGSAPPVINDWTADPISYPFILLEQISGWRAAPEADDNREARTYGEGEIAYPGRLLGKTLVYEGEVRADTREELRAQVTGLVNGYGDRSELGTMTVTPFSSIGGVVWQYQARVLAFDPDPVFTYMGEPNAHPASANASLPGPWRVGFTLSLRMLDPRFYTPDLAGTGYL